MKVSKYFMGLFGALALFACTDEEQLPNSNPDVTEGDSHFMAVEITTTRTGGSTRAAGDQWPSNPGEGDAIYEEGTSTENEVKSLRFYFFDEDKNPVAVSVGGTVNYVDVDSKGIKPEENGTTPPEGWANVEKRLSAVIVINTKENGTAKGVNSMVAVANYENAELGSNSLSLADLQQKVGAYEESGKGPFIMTSSVFGADQYNCETKVTAVNLCTSAEDAVEHPVKIYVERVVAQVRVKANWSTFDPKIETKQLKFEGITYDAVKLTHKDGEPYLVDGKPVYAIFRNWRVTGTAKQSYLFKNVANWTGWNNVFDNWLWNNPSWFRSYWAINPAKYTGTEAKSEIDWAKTDGEDKYYLQYYPFTDIKGVIGNNQTADGQSDKAEMSRMYCQENAGTPKTDGKPDGTKATYDSSTTLSNRTQAIFTAILVKELETADDKGNTAEPLTITQWGGQEYSLSDLKKAMLGHVSTLIYERIEGSSEDIKDENDNIIGTKWKTTTISENDLEFVTGGSDVEQDGKRYAAYLKLTTAAESKTFYKDSEGKVEYAEGEVNKIFENMPHAKIYTEGNTYYYHDINHLGEGDTTGKYGIVRNHIYEIELKEVYGLGTPIYNPGTGEGEDSKPIIPENPKDDETYLAAKIHVLSWRVVNNNATLDWD